GARRGLGTVRRGRAGTGVGRRDRGGSARGGRRLPADRLGHAAALAAPARRTPRAADDRVRARRRDRRALVRRWPAADRRDRRGLLPPAPALGLSAVSSVVGTLWLTSMPPSRSFRPVPKSAGSHLLGALQSP